VIYHIDEKVPDQSTRGYPGHPNWPAKHYMVAVVQADGKFQIEKGESAGGESDFWLKGDVLRSGGDWPNTDSYQGGNRLATGVEIEVTSASQFIMSFKVSGMTAASANRTSNETRTNRINSLESDPNTTLSTITWLITMFGGVAAMLGMLVVVL
jgi:hypothetical protein